jgi:hypothetical protein
MVTQIGNRSATKDVDALFPDIPDPGASPLYPALQASVRAVAARRALPANWINDVIADALRNYGPVPQGTVWRSYESLDVMVPEIEYMLALKILAGRPVDVMDAQDLCQRAGIVTRDQARRILDRYITDDGLKRTQGVDATLAQLYP